MSSSVSSTAPAPSPITSNGSRDPGPPRPFLSGGTSPPIIIGFIGVGAFSLGIVTLCAWRKLTGRDLLVRRARALGEAGFAAGGKPEMYDVWADGVNTTDTKWENVIPFAVTVLTEPVNNGTYASKPSRAKDKAAEPVGGADGTSLQVAVLLAMPSPHHSPHGPSDAKSSSASTYGEELAIGLAEVPWTTEYDGIMLRHLPR